jgi:hypothetical protein
LRSRPRNGKFAPALTSASRQTLSSPRYPADPRELGVMRSASPPLAAACDILRIFAGDFQS